MCGCCQANGDCYEGFWLNVRSSVERHFIVYSCRAEPGRVASCQDMREGSGSYFYAESGKVFVGEWVSDLPKAGYAKLVGYAQQESSAILSPKP